MPVEPPPPLETPYEVDPAACDAGIVDVDTVGSCTVTVTNVSTIDVNITAATDGPPFIALGAGGAAMVPGESRVITVNAVPRVVGVEEGELSLGPGRLIVPLRVEGTAPDVIVDVVVAPQNPAVGETVTLDASGSAPATTFAWTMTERPAGATAELSSDDEAVVTFVPDVAGLYAFSITVADADGNEATVTLVVEVRALLDVALTTTGGVLHVRPASEAPCGPLDCFAGSCTTEGWTAAGGGIVIDNLEEGTYRATLMVGAGDPAVADATARVFVSGNLRTEALASIAAGDAVDVFELVADSDGVNVTELGETVAGGACE